MVKILNPSIKKGFRGTEQYNDCSSMLKASDDPSLEELDPAILSCGLPAIMLSDIQPRMVVVPPRIRYSPGQLQAIRRSTLSFRRPAIVDDPRVAQFAIWRQPATATAASNHQSSRGGGRGCRPYVSPHSEPKDDDDKGSHTKDRPLERTNAQQKLYRENGFVAPRFRRNFEFSNRSQHAIVRSHAGGGDDRNHHGHQESAAAEDEPEWMAAGPTSRLDTIELRGFDDDISPNASLDKAPSNNNSNNSSDPKLSCASHSTSHAEKHVSFYDDLQHYEHVHPQKQQRGGSQGRDDVESVATSTASSSPPARSTPTKRLGGGEPGSNDDKPEAGGNQKQKSPQLPQNGINVHNFEQFMKFESFLGPDTSSNDQTASRFTKWFRRNSSGQSQPPSGSTFDGHYQAQEGSVDFGSGYDIRYQLERIRQQQQQHQQHPTSSIPRGGFHSQQAQNRPQNDIPTNAAFRRLIDMLAANYAKNDMIAQQQYLLEVLNRGQQNENLRRMLLQNPQVPSSSALPQSVPQQQQQQQRQRIPTQSELQYHTQTIMQNALLRKKLQDQRKLLQNQNNQMAAAAAVVAGEPSPLVQQFVQSVCPNLQRSLSVLNQTAASIGGAQSSSVPVSRQQFQGIQQFPGVSGGAPRAEASPMFPGGPSHAELSASLQQMLQSPPAPTQQQPAAQPKPARSQQNQGRGAQQQAQPSQQQQQQQQPAQRSGRRFGKGSVTWSNVHVPRP